MKQPERDHVLALDHPPSLNPLRSAAVAIAVFLAFAAAIYFAIG